MRIRGRFCGVCGCGVLVACCRGAGVCWWLGWLGVVFGFFIVDASIFVAIAVLFVPRTVSLLLPLVWVGVGCVCGVASYEGHMVDALASRADEGRSSLR